MRTQRECYEETNVSLTEVGCFLNIKMTGWFLYRLCTFFHFFQLKVIYMLVKSSNTSVDITWYLYVLWGKTLENFQLGVDSCFVNQICRVGIYFRYRLEKYFRCTFVLFYFISYLHLKVYIDRNVYVRYHQKEKMCTEVCAY